jgi:uncharacterized protein YkwD
MQVREMKRAIVLIGLMLALISAVAGRAEAAATRPAATERLRALDAAIFHQLNATRRANGLRPLARSGRLGVAAITHSHEMIDGGFFAHDTPGGDSFARRLKRFYPPSGYRTWSGAENIISSSEAMDAAAAIRAWLDSPPHRANMLNPRWREVGIGSLQAASAGGVFGGKPTWVVTMDFGLRLGSGRAASR